MTEWPKVVGWQCKLFNDFCRTWFEDVADVTKCKLLNDFCRTWFDDVADVTDVDVNDDDEAEDDDDVVREIKNIYF